MKAVIISITEKGRILSESICRSIAGKYDATRYTFHKNSDENSVSFSDINSIVSDVFYDSEVVIFVCACGIAVRSIAPFVHSKESDPAVIVIDDNGKFVIPILSGHLGGANALAKYISEKIGALPVITTATDIGGKFSPDSFAKANNLIIVNISAAKEIAAAVLGNEKIGLISDYECINIPSDIVKDGNSINGICISADINKKPFENTLNLVPKNVVIGIGCKRGTDFKTIEKHISDSLEASGIEMKRICAVATIDIKSDEKGLLEFCEKYGVKLFTYTADELMSVSGNFTRSDFVLSQTGTDNVCERGVVKSGGKLIMRKKTANGVTAAAGEIPVTIDFAKEIL